MFTSYNSLYLNAEYMFIPQTFLDHRTVGAKRSVSDNPTIGARIARTVFLGDPAANPCSQIANTPACKPYTTLQHFY